MKQTLLKQRHSLLRSVVTLLTFCCALGVSWGAEYVTVYSMTNPTGPTGNIDTKKGVDLVATYTDGTGYLYNGKSSAAALVNSSGVNLGGSSSSYLKITLSSSSIQEGDIIDVTDGTNSLVKSGGTALKITTTASTSSPIQTNFPYTVPKGSSLKDKSVLYLWKDGNSSFKVVTIKRLLQSSTETPSFTTNLSTTAYEAIVGKATTLTVTAKDVTGYQWYSCTDATGAGATAITGATTSKYDVTPSAEGTTYYYCVATNDNATGEKTARSNVATVNAAASSSYAVTWSNTGGWGMRSVTTSTDTNTKLNSGVEVDAGTQLVFTTDSGAGWDLTWYVNDELQSQTTSPLNVTINGVTKVESRYVARKKFTFSDNPKAKAYADASGKITLSANNFSYQDGKSCTSWTGNDGNTYEVGKQYTLTNDVVLTPVFANNTVALGDEEATVTWSLGYKADNTGCPVFSSLQGTGSVINYVQQATIGGKKIDVSIVVDGTSGKADNERRVGSSNTQLNTNTKITIPAMKGMVVTYNAGGVLRGSGKTATTIAGSSDYTLSSDSKIATYTYNGEESTIDIVVGNDYTYANSISVKYPYVEKYDCEYLTWKATNNTTGLTTASKDSEIRGITASKMGDFTLNGGLAMMASNSASANGSGKIVTTASKVDDDYLSFTVNIGENHLFTPVAIKSNCVSVSSAKTYVYQIADNNGHVWTSAPQEMEKSASAAETNTFVVNTTDQFSGVVTVKLWVYGDDKGYRINNIQLGGSNEATKTFTTTFDAGTDGSVSETTISEESIGSGIVLPAATPTDASLLFAGWATTEGAATADAGKAGETYYPGDDETLYAIYKTKVVDFAAILNNETGTLIQSSELTQGTAVSFGVKKDSNDKTVRCLADDPDCIATISGTYHNDHGVTGLTVQVPVYGNTMITIGECSYSGNTITVKNSDNQVVATATPTKECWKGNHTATCSFYYFGEPTTLTITGPAYCPYIAVKSVNELQQYAVNFYNGNELVTSTMVYEHQGLGTLPTVTVPSGKRFRGWYTKNDGTGGEKATETTVLTTDQTYYAYIADIPVVENNGYYIVDNSGNKELNGQNLLNIIEWLNEQNGPAKVFLPNGNYDFGSAAETPITASNVSFIGESTEGVVISTTPKNEGLGKADLFLNKGNNNYFEDLTLNNTYPYSSTTGRAPAFHDQGRNTIFKDCYVLSHQDTYYSHKAGAYYYFEGGKIHGCVDYLCGSGNVFFEGVTLENDARQSTITANSEAYVFNNCTIVNAGSEYNFGRAWSDSPICVFINTKLSDNGAKLASNRWTAQGINTVYGLAGEYNTMNAEGTNITPASKTVTFKGKDGVTATLETILTADQAAAYSYANFFASASWDPASICAQAVADADNVDAEAAYLIEDNGQFVALLKGSEITLANYNGMTIRKANERGGFGEAVTITATPAPEVQEGQVFVFTDPHVVTKAVAAGNDFTSDNKMPEYSQEIFDIMIGKIKAAMPEMVLVPGDLTYNGEKSGHEYVSAKLNELTDLGIKVYVIPGNHDIANSNAIGGATTITKDEFVNMYGAQGYNDAVMQSDNASYMVYPNDDLAIIGINTSLPSYNSNGGISYDLMTWVENAAAKAKLSGRQVIAMTHHQLMEHFDNQLKASATSVCNINLHESDAAHYPSIEEVRERLLAAGINTVFTGHYHIQSVSQVVNDTYGTLTDISTGALSGYPMAYRTATIEKARITTASANITEDLSEITNAEVLSTGTTRLNNRATEMATGMLGVTAELASNMLGSAVCALAAGNEQDASNKTSQLSLALSAINAAKFLGKVTAENATLGTAVVNSIWNNTINGTFVDDYACNKAYPNLNLTFNDGTEYTCTQASGIFNVTYRRSFKDGIYQPLFVPFSFPMSAINPSAEDDNYLVAEFAAEPVEQGEDGKTLVKLTSQENSATVSANTPYIIKRTGDGQMAAYIEQVQFEAVPNNLTLIDHTGLQINGTYEPLTGLKTLGAYALKDNMLKPAANDAVTLKPQRWFMTLPVTSAKPSIMFVIDDQPTGITTPMAPAAMRNAKYSIGGMQLQNASPAQGIIITDGAKYSTK